MGQKHKDNGRALLVGSINNVATSLTIEAGKADRFPVGTTTDWLTPADWFKVVLIDSSGNREVVKVGVRNSGSGVLGNLQRAQDGTAALSFTAGSVVVQSFTATDMQQLRSDIDAVAAGTFTSAFTQNGVVSRAVPVGGIIMWSGKVSAVPAGFRLCDGANGTPDLRNRFILGSSTDDATQSLSTVTGGGTKTGGVKDAVVPAHSHGVNINANTGGMSNNHSHAVNDFGHSHISGVASDQGVFGLAGVTGTLGKTGVQAYGTSPVTTVAASGISLGAADTDHIHNVTMAGATASAGVSGTDANLPPYYALAFIMCVSGV